MVKMEEVMSACATDEGTTLIAKFLKRKLPNANENELKFATLTLMQSISEQLTVPEGADCNQFVLAALKALAED